ncbi:MAG: ABC transporter permease [Candidatus Saccharimonadales bacterium]
MIRENIRLALLSIRQSKLRSFLTMLGLIIGVGSVVAVLAIGEGVKREISNQVSEIGTNLLNISPGNLGEGEFNPSLFASSTLTEQDLEDVRQLPNIDAAVAVTIITGTPEHNGTQAQGASIIGTNAEYTRVVNQRVENGNFFSPESRFQAVIGTATAETLFPSSSPIGQIITLRQKQFEVIGVMEEYDSGGFNLGGMDFNNVVYVPLEAAKSLTGGNLNILEIDAKVTTAEEVDTAITQIENAILANHGGVKDFSVLKQEDAIKLFNSIFGIVTSFIAAVASISLLVGGIGIMNIMLVSVTERTREIGIRKAIGANNRHILIQFLTEALTLSLIGGLLGIAFAFLIGLIASAVSPLQSHITLGSIALAVGVSVGVGTVFGIAPALKAARKNPIDALRYE